MILLEDNSSRVHKSNVNILNVYIFEEVQYEETSNKLLLRHVLEWLYNYIIGHDKYYVSWSNMYNSNLDSFSLRH